MIQQRITNLANKEINDLKSSLSMTNTQLTEFILQLKNNITQLNGQYEAAVEYIKK